MGQYPSQAQKAEDQQGDSSRLLSILGLQVTVSLSCLAEDSRAAAAVPLCLIKGIRVGKLSREYFYIFPSFSFLFFFSFLKIEYNQS